MALEGRIRGINIELERAAIRREGKALMITVPEDFAADTVVREGEAGRR